MFDAKGRLVKDAARLNAGDDLSARLDRGQVRARVTATNTDGSGTAQSDQTAVVAPVTSSAAPKNTSAPESFYQFVRDFRFNDRRFNYRREGVMPSLARPHISMISIISILDIVLVAILIYQFLVLVRVTQDRRSESRPP